jgi:CxxC motif-containing protein (DUF1111 family)
MRQARRNGVIELTVIGLFAGLLAQATIWLDTAGAAQPKPKKPAQVRAGKDDTRLGRELFNHPWVPGDRRSHGGDGLGPVFNERSCLGCHHQGGPDGGGGGSADKNVEIITPVRDGTPNGQNASFFYAFSFNFGGDGFEYRLGSPPMARNGLRRANGANLADLVQIHPGFRDAASVVLHRYGNDADYRVWREWVLGRHGTIAFRTSQRNPTPLFGAGLIDRVHEAAIEAAARRRHPGWPQIKGRPSRLADGRVGRFGWKAQTASLDEFIRAAAAVELGLQVPGHEQAADPRVPPLKALGLDMDATECDSLTAYVRSLPAPRPIARANPRDERALKAGKTLFKAIGCAECHVPRLGDIDNFYCDLLLHVMSPNLGDTPAYGAFLASTDAKPAKPVGPEPARPLGTATDDEWRTPPLWGLRDSAPYLHDGRAETIEDAILLHGGEASASALRYQKLAAREQAEVQFFLLSLGAPQGPGPNPGESQQ